MKMNTFETLMKISDDECCEIANEPLPPNFETPESYNQLNSILSYYNVSNLQCSDSIREKALLLQKIQQNLKEVFFTEDILEQLDRIEKYKEIETDCDLMEVKLANLKTDSIQRFDSKGVEELLEILEELKKKHRQSKIKKEEYESCKELVEKISRGHSLDSLWFYKDCTRGAYLKQKILDKLMGKDEEYAKVLHKIVKDGVCKVEDIGNELCIERVDLLRTIYNYSAKGILEYDRLNDSVSIKENKHL